MDKQVQDYIKKIPKAQRPLFDKLESIILDLYPDADVVLYYNIPTYKSNTGQVSLAVQPKHVGLYTTGAENLVKFKEKYPKMKTGKASVTFTSVDEIPIAGVKQVINSAMGKKKA
jgi:uncharacterized protein YdhG (YjbR/CyaY superfamily)